MTKPDHLNLVDTAGSFPRVRLVPPNPYGYLLAAAVVDHRPPSGFFLEGRHKRKLLTALKDLVAALAATPGVRNATLLKTLVAPPGRGAFLKQRPHVHVAHYDVALWVETDDPQTCVTVCNTAAWHDIEAALRGASEDVQVIYGRNPRRIGDVDHDRDGVFLLNYFYADDAEQNLAVWEYTAGWFQDQTGLDNSIVLLPEGGTPTDYVIVNHCRWDRLRDVAPSLVFKRSFRTYVLAHFEANATAPMPILYRLA